MNYYTFKVLFSVAIAAVLNLPGVAGNPYLIADDRIRSMDITPVLGRGYSIMTNSFQSTCLDVNEVTIPSFNYDCKCESALLLETWPTMSSVCSHFLPLLVHVTILDNDVLLSQTHFIASNNLTTSKQVSPGISLIHSSTPT